MIYGLTPLGAIHTAISLVAVAAALIAFVRDKQIDAGKRLGQVYIWTTVLTCLTGSVSSSTAVSASRTLWASSRC